MHQIIFQFVLSVQYPLGFQYLDHTELNISKEKFISSFPRTHYTLANKTIYNDLCSETARGHLLITLEWNNNKYMNRKPLAPWQ